ncbi:MAG: hypothetical protein ACE37F_07835 [Nannocystaceae bacterium]|nr:hypothetical protein [bacterium]
MNRLASRLVFASLLLGACSSSGGGPVEDAELVMEERLVGGWDGASTTKTSVLLIREGLTGTLSTTRLTSDEEEYELSFSVSGEVSEDDDEIVVFNLACDEARARPLAAPDAPDEDPMGSADTDDTAAEAPAVETRDWDGLDCAGWELQLECGVAGECGSADCNLFCDIVYFGDAFATASIELASIEDELDHWQRV